VDSFALGFGIYCRVINNFFVDVGAGIGDVGVLQQAGLLYTFKGFYVSAGYRQYIFESYTSTFYGGVGVGLSW
jgi:hypothetical protein